jgi:small GTP-binding protein
MARKYHQMGKLDGLDFREITIGIFGRAGVGKTTLFNAYLGVNREVRSTIGVNCQYGPVTESLSYGSYRLKLKDTAGQPEWRDSIRKAVRDLHCVVLVYALDDRDSFTELQNYLALGQGSPDSPDARVPWILVGNKSDQPSAEGITELSRGFAEQYGALHQAETSARENTGVEELFKFIGDSEEVNAFWGTPPPVPQAQETAPPASQTPWRTRCSVA